MKNFEEKKNIPAVIISGAYSGAGKTSLTIGIIAALRKRGLNVQAFKVGPDFIDIGHHAKASSNHCRNLDGWMLPESAIKELFLKNVSNSDIAVIEGVAGLFDGYGCSSDEGSTAQISKLLGIPVVLVVDAGAMSRSVGALVLGYDSFDKDLNIDGVIFNKVASDSHLKTLTNAVEQNTKTTILGGINKNPEIFLEERHLGLLMAEEDKLESKYINKLAEVVEKNINLDKILTIANSNIKRNCGTKAPISVTKTRIGVARDEAFCFYYEDNFDLLRELGAELIEFSPIRDKLPENIDGLYFGGGYPELYAEKLSQNEKMLKDLNDFAESGGVIYAECGGLMYLGQELNLFDGSCFPLTKVLPYKTKMTKKLKLAYTELETNEDIKLFPAKAKIRGHIFHYSSIENDDAIKKVYKAITSSSRFEEGYSYKNVLASYVHLHFWSNPSFAEHFVDFCSDNSKINKKLLIE